MQAFIKCNVIQIIGQLKRNTWLHFWQFENKFFKITYSTILKKKGIINTRYKNKINKIQC